MSYDLIFQAGELFPGQPILRTKAVTASGTELKDSKRGYGVTEIDAAQDFIRRNSQVILEKVFDTK